jgi:pimeloyl-ACP methyl ester carboxylesterase
MSKVTSRDGTTIGYDRQGEGPAVILVGGAMQYRGFDSRTDKMARLLSTRFTVFNYDRRGRGESSDTAPYAVDREIEDIAALIEAADGTAMLYGSSSGAVLALEVAEKGLPIGKLALYEPPLKIEESGLYEGDFPAELTALAAGGKHGAAVEHFLRAGIGIPDEHIAGMRQSPAWPGMEAIAPTLAYDTLIMAPFSTGKGIPAGKWSNVSIPALVISGDASFPFMPAAADAVAERLSNARRKILAGQDHGPTPESIVPVLEEFFGD